MIEPFDVAATSIEGLLVLRPKSIHDERGSVRELFRASAFRDAGIDIGPWRQINATESARGAIRGLHGETMTKLVGVVSGWAYGAYVDVRPSSPTAGVVVTVELRIGVQVLIPPGVCNGFQSFSDERTQYVYCFDDEWAPDMPGSSVNPLDPDLGIEWPITPDPDDPAQVSAKDAALPMLRDVLAAR